MVERVEGRTLFSKQFKNTSAGLVALVKFIRERCLRPKICLQSTRRSALNLIKYISTIPDVEVVLMSESGLRTHQTWLPKIQRTAFFPRNATQAELLACCAERVI
jgi:hypothetical protein